MSRNNPGNSFTLDNHIVRVGAEPRIHNSTSKYYMIDIKIEAVYEQSNPIKAISETLQIPDLGIRPAIKPLKKPESKPEPETKPHPSPPKKSKSASSWRQFFD